MKMFQSRHLRKLTMLALTGTLVLTGFLATQATGNADVQRSVPTAAHPGAAKPTIVLVHGAWADSSGWTKVTQRLQGKGYEVLAPSMPMRGLRSDAKYLAAFLRDRTAGPVILVGHSYAGAVITNAAKADDDVAALVYVNAFVPDKGDSVLGLLDPGHVLNPADLFDFVQYPGAVDGDVDLYLKQDVFPDAIANGIPAPVAKSMAAAQRPITFSSLTAASGRPAWKSLPSYYLLGTEDHIVPPDLQRAMATHAGARITEVKSGHLPMITNPSAVGALIVQAARRASHR